MLGGVNKSIKNIFLFKEHFKFMLIKALHSRLNKELCLQLIVWSSGCESTESSTQSYSLKGKEHCQ